MMITVKRTWWLLLLSVFLMACGGPAVDVIADPTATVAAPTVAADPTAAPDSVEAETASNVDPAADAAAWLLAAHQNEDGGFTSFSAGAGEAPSTVEGTIDATFALAAADAPLEGVRAFFEADPVRLADYASVDGGQAGKLVLGLTAAGLDPRDVGGEDFVAALQSHVADDGAIDLTPLRHSLGLLGLVAAGEPMPDGSVIWVEAQQQDGGSWGDGFGTTDSVDATAFVVQALAAAGVDPDADSLTAARAFLAAAQNEDTAGWAYSASEESGTTNPNSTAMVVQALTALGEDATAPASAWTQNGISPAEALLAFQNPDTGAFQSDFGDGPFDDFFATVQAVPAVALDAYPVE